MTTYHMTADPNLLDAYVERILEDMDLESLLQLATDNLKENLSRLTPEELITEIEEYYPDMLTYNISKVDS